MLRKLKISTETYHRLNRLAESLGSTTDRPASMDATIAHLLKNQAQAQAPAQASASDFEGAWEMDDDEAKEIAWCLVEMWGTWRPDS